MPLPLFAGAAIGAAGSVLGSGINAWQTGRMNEKSMKFSREMYQRQYDDNLRFWQMQNEYNTPAAQMQRFREAGLNPALIYGQTNTAGPLTSPDVQKPQFETPRWGDMVPNVLATLDATTNLELKQAQIDNVKAQNDVIKADAILKGSLISGVEASTRGKILQYNKDLELYDTDVTARKEALRKLQTDIDLSLRRDTREALMNASNLSEASERIKSMVQDRGYKRQQIAQSREEVIRIREDTKRIVEQISLMQKEGKIKALDAWLADQSIRPGDPVWYRAIASFFDTMIEKFSK